MMVSTRGHYALTVMIDLSEQRTQRFIPLKEIAQRQGLSEKYLESIVKLLVQSGYIEGLRGKGGGYRLKKAPSDCAVGDILALTEDALTSPDEAASLHTKRMWQGLRTLIREYLQGFTIADLMREDSGDDYVI